AWLMASLRCSGAAAGAALAGASAEAGAARATPATRDAATARLETNFIVKLSWVAVLRGRVERSGVLAEPDQPEGGKLGTGAGHGAKRGLGLGLAARESEGNAEAGVGGVGVHPALLKRRAVELDRSGIVAEAQ